MNYLIQVIFGVAYVILVRYGDSANAKHIQNQIHGEDQDEDLKENLAKYPSKFFGIDSIVQMI